MANVAHSYADPFTACVHLRLRGEGNEFRDLVELARDNPRDDSFRLQLYGYAWNQHRNLVIHEWAHVFQLATYPYLLLRSARAGRVMAGPATFLSTNPDRYPLPLEFAMDESWELSSMLGTIPFKTIVRDTEVEFRPVIGDGIGRAILTERDLLEEDATVMQYRAEISGQGTGKAYRNWLRERPRYTRLFSFLSTHFGDDAALWLLPIMVRVAYRTTRPLQSFLRSFGTLKIEGTYLYADRDDDVFLEEILFSNLQSTLDSVDVDDLGMQQPEVDDPEGVIDDQALGVFADRFVHLPITLLTQLDLNGTDEQRGIAHEVMRKPWDFFDRYDPDIDTRLYDYLPPAITIALDDPSFPVGSSLLSISPLLSNTPFPGIPDQTYAHWMNALIKGRLMSQSLRQTTISPQTRCPHEGCAYHPTGLCRDWITVPRSSEDCEFPEVLTYTTKHRLSADGVALEPVPTTEES